MLFRLFTLLAVIALVLSTWILTSPGHRPALTSSTEGAALPGYYLKTAVLTDYDEAGYPGIRLDAGRIDQVDHGDEVVLSDVHVHYQAPNDQNWVITGDRGRVEPGGKVVDLSGNVILHGEGTGQAGIAIVHTETLRYDVADSIVTTQDDVRVEFGVHTLSARGMRANLKDRTLHLDSKVNGRFER
jgi:LPS export ABC transporter protein LptC